MKGPMVIRERCEIDMKDKWAVEDLYASDELWYADLEKMKAAGIDVDALDLSGVTEITIDETLYIGSVK